MFDPHSKWRCRPIPVVADQMFLICLPRCRPHRLLRQILTIQLRQLFEGLDQFADLLSALWLAVIILKKLRFLINSLYFSLA